MKNLLVTLFGITILSACSFAPKPDALSQLTIVRFGDQIPVGQDYILLFEAGKPIPLNILINGSLLDKGVDLQETVTLSKSIYSYQGWVSYDGVYWKKRDKMLDFRLRLRLPGYENPNPGLIHLGVDER